MAREAPSSGEGGREGHDCQALQGRGSQRPRPGVTTGLAPRGAIERHGGPLEACGRRGRACPFMVAAGRDPQELW